MLSIPSEVQTLAEAERLKYALMFRVELDGGPQGLWNWNYDVTVDGCTYRGIGGNIQTDAFSGSAALDVDNITAQIVGLASNAQSLIDNENWHQRPCSVFIAFLDDADAIIHTMVRYSGFLDSCPFVDNTDEDSGLAGTSTLKATVENSNRALDLATGRVRSDSDQRSVGGSTDGFGKYITAANSKAGEIVWGRKGPQSPVR